GAWSLDHPDAVIAVDQLPCVVGRHPGCDRLLPHPRVSRRHCAFWLRDGRAWVEDLGSRNGTRLNGEPLTKASPLGEGDRLDLAGLPFLCLSLSQVRQVHALADLKKEDPLKAQLVTLRYFTGMSMKDTAAVLGLSERTAHRHWRFVKAWLKTRLGEPE